jgi:ubiquitin-protein ligase E3 C
MSRADRMGSRDDRYSQNQRSCRATIRRETLAEDGFRQLNHEGPRLRGRIKITFVDQYVLVLYFIMSPGSMTDDRFGQEESGIDGGGLFKEFLTSLSKEAFDTNRGLWLVTDENQLYPNPHSYAKEGKLSPSIYGRS